MRLTGKRRVVHHVSSATHSGSLHPVVSMQDCKEYSQHPLSAAFPAMPFEDLEDLSEDIRLNGLEEPITLFEGQVLDGWHRYKAGNMVGAPLRYVQFDGEDPIKFVLSKNLKRRHLTASQRAMIAVKCLVWKPQGRPAKQVEMKRGNVAPFSDDAASQLFQVSERTIKSAKAADRNGFAAEVLNGEMSADEAARNGKPKRKSKPKAPEPQTAELMSRVEQLEEMLSDYEECNKQLLQLQSIMDSEDKLAAAHKEIKRLNEVVRILEERQVGLMNAETSAIRSAKSWKRKYESKNEKLTDAAVK